MKCHEFENIYSSFNQCDLILLKDIEITNNDLLK